MNADDYQKAALRTEHTPRFLRGREISVGNIEREDLDQLERIMHAMIGVCTEAGELQDMVKKHLIYGKPFDTVNVVEECGDLLWYIAVGLDACGVKMGDAMQRNITKLQLRFPDKFTEERALNRDLDAERAALERK